MINLTAEYVDSKNDLGIINGQMRADDFVHNGGWYNAKGEKIGWGDLSKEDLERITNRMAGQPFELFIVLGEHDSFWPFVTSVGPIGSLCGVEAKEKNPGLDYVAEHARYVITGGGMYSLRSDESYELGSIMVNPMTRERLREIMRT